MVSRKKIPRIPGFRNCDIRSNGKLFFSFIGQQSEGDKKAKISYMREPLPFSESHCSANILNKHRNSYSSKRNIIDFSEIREQVKKDDQILSAQNSNSCLPMDGSQFIKRINFDDRHVVYPERKSKVQSFDYMQDFSLLSSQLTPAFCKDK